MNNEYSENSDKWDSLSACLAIESGECDQEEVISAFQFLIDTGIVWRLQGSYGRAAHQLIQTGYCRFAVQ